MKANDLFYGQLKKEKLSMYLVVSEEGLCRLGK